MTFARTCFFFTKYVKMRYKEPKLIFAFLDMFFALISKFRKKSEKI